MPRFYFDSRIEDRILNDEEGMEFASAGEAVAYAKEGLIEYGADHLQHGLPPDHEETLVRSEHGEIVASLHIKDVMAEKTNLSP